MLNPRDELIAAMRRAFGPDAILPNGIEPGRLHRFSTNGKRSDTAGWCKLFADLRAGVYGCHRSGMSEVWSMRHEAAMTLGERAALRQQVRQALAERDAEQRQRWAVNAKRNAELMAEAVPLVRGDPVTLYLRGRGLAGTWPLPVCLRLHRSLTHWHDGESSGPYPAMLAPVVAPNGALVAVHRTFLTRDGRKAPVPTVKKLTGASGPLAGACIPLHSVVGARVIGIAEGIETALAAWRASTVPTVAAYCADNMACWRWPSTLERLLVFGDADPAGRAAADKLVTRALQRGLRAEAITPSEPGADWADVWAARCNA